MYNPNFLNRAASWWYSPLLVMSENIVQTQVPLPVMTNAVDFLALARAGDLVNAESAILAARSAGPDSLRALLSAADDISGNTPLHMAAGNGHIRMLKLLLDAGAPRDKRNSSGSAPLHYSAVGKAVECAEALVNAGADLFIENNAGATPLDDAICVGGGMDGEVAKLLMTAAEKQAANIDGPDLAAGTDASKTDCHDNAAGSGKE